MRSIDTLAQFLRRFEALYPQLGFRAMRQLHTTATAEAIVRLHLAVGSAGVPLVLDCHVLSSGTVDAVARWLRAMEDEGIAAREAQPDARELTQGSTVVVARSLDIASKRALREHARGYLDLEGAVFIESQGVYIDIDSAGHSPLAETSFRSPFGGKRERIVRRLLLQPDRHWSMRALARAADVSVGLASNATSALAQMNMVSKDRSGLDLFDPRALLDAWSAIYDLRRSVFATYRSGASTHELVETLVRERSLLRHRYALTLWTAARSRLPDLTTGGAHLALYWLGSVDELVDVLHLDPEQGRSLVFCFQPYDEALLWGMEALAGLYVVHPIQLYLDLACGDQREAALAHRVRDELLPW